MATLAEQWAGAPLYYLGGLVFASLWDNVLLGALSLETFSYFHWFQQDPWTTLSLVSVLFFLNLLQSGTVMAYMYLVFLSALPKSFETVVAYVNVEFEVILIIEACSSALAQIFFLKRAYGLTGRNKPFLIVCSSLILTGLGLGFTSSILTMTAPTGNDTVFSDFFVLTNIIIAWKSSTVLVDFILTCTIVTMLLRSRTRFRETNHVVTSLVRFTAEAQILPLIAGLCFLGLYAYDPNANFSLIPSFTETKLTALSVVHVLNSRGRLRREAGSSEQSTGRTPQTLGAKTRGGVSVYVETHVHHSEAEARRKDKAKRDQRALRDLEDGISLESFERGVRPEGSLVPEMERHVVPDASASEVTLELGLRRHHQPASSIP